MSHLLLFSLPPPDPVSRRLRFDWTSLDPISKLIADIHPLSPHPNPILLMFYQSVNTKSPASNTPYIISIIIISVIMVISIEMHGIDWPELALCSTLLYFALLPALATCQRQLWTSALLFPPHFFTIWYLYKFYILLHNFTFVSCIAKAGKLCTLNLNPNLLILILILILIS